MFNPMRTLKSIAGFKTQKIIREEHLKEDFFQHILRQIKTDLTSEEDDFLMNYLLSQKYGVRENKISQETQDTLKENISPVDIVDTSLYQSSRNIFQRRNLTACEGKHPKIKPKISPSLVKTSVYTNSISDDLAFHRNNHIRNETRSQEHSKTKFHKISFNIKRNRENYHLKESPKRYTDVNFSAGSITKEYLMKNYNEHFIKNIFGRHTFQVQEQSMLVDDAFKDTLSFRKTDQFEEEQRRQQKKYMNLTSIQFERSPRKRMRMKVNTRRF